MMPGEMNPNIPEKLQMSIHYIVFPRSAYMLTPRDRLPIELAWWDKYGSDKHRIFIDNDNFAAHYSYWNARELINTKMRSKIFNMVDRVIFKRLDNYPRLLPIIKEINDLIPSPIVSA
jgi:hypothetical protein